MAIDPWMIDASAGAPAYTAGEVRLATVVPMFAGAGASLGVRSGVRPSGSGTDLLVQAQVSPNMTVKVNTGVVVMQGSISTTQGAYTWALDTVTNLTISAAHATLTRTDLVVVRIRDAGVDTSGQRDGAVTVITGTAGGGVPSLPTDATYFTLAQIAVGAAVTTIVTGNITDRRPFAAALGGVIDCTSITEPAATSVMPGQPAYRTDLTNAPQRWSDGTNWQTAPRIIGGNKWVGGGNHVVGLAGTELSIFATPTIALPPNTVCRVFVSCRVLANTNGDTWLFNLRDTNVSGTIRGDYTWTNPNSVFGYKIQFEVIYETTVAENKAFALCAGRVGGTGLLTITAGSAGAPTYLMVSAAGPAGSLTTQATP